jgi:Plasmid pRiA4b ORF-3-like protein
MVSTVELHCQTGEVTSLTTPSIAEAKSPKGPRMDKSIDDRGRGARMARRDEGAYPSVRDRGATQPAGMNRPRGRSSYPFAGPKRVPNCLTFRLEYFPDQIGSFPDIPRPAPLKNWDRVFEVSDKLSLEQFASVILNLLAWDEDHLYEFHIGETIYVHMGDPECSDFFVDAVNPCVSCAIRLHYLNLSPGTAFDFVFDFGDWHLFG